MHTLTLRPGKITGKELLRMYEDLTITPIGNYLRSGRFEKAKDIWYNAMQKSFWSIVSKGTVAKWGKPNLNCRDLESSPGVWIFDDTAGVTWVIYSDMHHKHPWKGTSFEVSIDDGISDKTMCEVIQRFLDICKVGV